MSKLPCLLFTATLAPMACGPEHITTAEAEQHVHGVATELTVNSVFGGPRSLANLEALTFHRQTFASPVAQGASGWRTLTPEGDAPFVRGQYAFHDVERDRIIRCDANASSVVTLEELSSGSPKWKEHAFEDNTVRCPIDGVVVYDARTERLILHGADLHGDKTAIVDLKSTPPRARHVQPRAPRPSARTRHAGVYSPSNNSLIIVGGRELASGALTIDVWALQNANGRGGEMTWIELTPKMGPSPAVREDHSVVYDDATDRLLLFAGTRNGATHLPASVWMLEHASGKGGDPEWKPISTHGREPAPRAAHSMVYDTLNDRMIVFAGSLDAQSLSDETWVLADATSSNARWLELVTPSRPAARLGHSAVYLEAENAMLIFSAERGGDDQLWLLDNANGL